MADYSEDLKYMAEALHFEDGNGPLVCQIVLGQTIMNRVDQARFPNTIKEVVHEDRGPAKFDCQFSYFCDGKSDIIPTAAAEIESYQVATKILFGGLPDLSNGADHYYNPKLAAPDWGPLMTDTFMCGDHKFGKLEW